MVDTNIRTNITSLKKELEATILEIDAEISEARPSLKLLVPRDDVTKKYTLMGNKDVLVFIQTLLEKIFYTSPVPEEDEANLAYFKEQIEKSVSLSAENVKNAKSLHPAIGIPGITDSQYIQMVGRQEMFAHFKDMLTGFNL